MGRKRRRKVRIRVSSRVGNKNTLPGLPVDLHEEVLLRSPAQSVVRFKTVCRCWLERITSKHFLRSYHRIWRNRYGEPYGLVSRKACKWHPTEDRTLKAFVSLHGDRNWMRVAEESGLQRSPESCRVRWRCCLSTGLVKLRPIP